MWNLIERIIDQLQTSKNLQLRSQLIWGQGCNTFYYNIMQIWNCIVKGTSTKIKVTIKYMYRNHIYIPTTNVNNSSEKYLKFKNWIHYYTVKN